MITQKDGFVNFISFIVLNVEQYIARYVFSHVQPHVLSYTSYSDGEARGREEEKQLVCKSYPWMMTLIIVFAMITLCIK